MLNNVFFLWGRGKTTIANILRDRYGFFVYSTDEARDRLMLVATPEKQPYMWRDFEAEYGVGSFWELPSEVIADREVHFLEEMTPMIIDELIITRCSVKEQSGTRLSSIVRSFARRLITL